MLGRIAGMLFFTSPVLSLSKSIFTMKKLLPLLCALAFAFTADAQSPEFLKGDWNAALKKAKEQNKYILVDAYTDWCGWCKVMDKKTFPDPKVAEFIRANYIPVKLEMEKEADGRALAMKYHVNSFPTFMFFSPDGKLIKVSHGYEEPAAFVGTMKEGLAAPDEKTFPGYNNSALDPGFPEFYKQAFGAGKKAKPDEKAVKEFLDKQSSKTSELSWAVLWRFRSVPGCSELIMQNSKELARLYGAEEVDGAMIQVFYDKAYEANKSGDRKQLDAVLAEVDKYMNDNTEELKRQLTMNFLRINKNWKEYAAMMQGSIDKDGYEANADEINQVSWTLYEKCEDKDVLAQATGWMKRVVEIKPLYMYIDTYAALLYQTGQYKQARAQAELAIITGKEAGENVSSTESLLEMIKQKL